MQIDVKDIFDFYELRIKCHIESVNYFASILGYHFPEHDSNKTHEPIRTGYAYTFYSKYHKNFYLRPEHSELCEKAQDDHHKHSPHHIEYYEKVSDIPDVRLFEMLSDWASANFEQKNIIKDNKCGSLREWFKTISSLQWTKHQLDIINSAFDIFEAKTDTEQISTIWKPVLSKSDL